MSEINWGEYERGGFISGLASYLICHFADLRDLFDTVQDLLKQEKRRISESMESESSKLPTEKEDLYDWSSEDYWRFKDSYPILQRNAILIVAYAELEDVLRFICSLLANKKGIDVRVYEWRGGILERVESFFKKNIGIDFPSNDNMWIEIKNARDIRNKIVHNDSWLDNDKDKEIIDYINNNKKDKINLIKRETEGNGKYRFCKIQLTDTFIHELFETMDGFLLKLLGPISDWVHRAPVF